MEQVTVTAQDTATVVVPQEPSIEVIKTVWDPEKEEWVDEINANVGDVVRFQCIVHNDGKCCNLTRIVATDILSDSLEYANEATVDGEPWEPVFISEKEFGWNFKDRVLSPSQSIVIEFNAKVVKCGVDQNLQMAKAVCEDGQEVSHEDTATVIGELGRWDINEDGKVDYKDLAILGRYYGGPPEPPYIRADINEDGEVDLKDLAMLSAHYGDEC